MSSRSSPPEACTGATIDRASSGASGRTGATATRWEEEAMETPSNRVGPLRWAGAAGALAAILLASGTASALYLDDDHNVSLRLRAYSQASMATQGAEVQTDPGKGVGQFVSQRNFANPE